MSLASYAIKAGTSKCIQNDLYKLFVRGSEIIISDGTQEWTFGPATGDNFSPSVSIYEYPIVSNNQIILTNTTLIESLKSLATSLTTNITFSPTTSLFDFPVFIEKSIATTKTTLINALQTSLTGILDSFNSISVDMYNTSYDFSVISDGKHKKEQASVSGAFSNHALAIEDLYNTRLTADMIKKQKQSKSTD